MMETSFITLVFVMFKLFSYEFSNFLLDLPKWHKFVWSERYSAFNFSLICVWLCSVLFMPCLIMSFRDCHRDAILYHFSSHFSPRRAVFLAVLFDSNFDWLIFLWWTFVFSSLLFLSHFFFIFPSYFLPVFLLFPLSFSPLFPPVFARALSLSHLSVCRSYRLFQEQLFEFSPVRSSFKKLPSSTFYTQDTFFSAPCKKYWIFSSENEISSIFGRGRITKIGTWFCLATKWRTGHGVCPTLRAPRARQFFNPVKLIDQKIIFIGNFPYRFISLVRLKSASPLELFPRFAPWMFVDFAWHFSEASFGFVDFFRTTKLPSS